MEGAQRQQRELGHSGGVSRGISRLEAERCVRSRGSHRRGAGHARRGFLDTNSNKAARTQGFPGGSAGKNLPSLQETGVQSRGGEDPLERKWQRTPIFLPGKSHGQRSLVGHSPWGHKESDTTEKLSSRNNAYPWCPFSG